MPELQRRLSRFDLTMLVVGACIGSGVFLTPSSIAAALPSPLAMLGVWALGGLMTFCGALTYAELGAMMPRAGGPYVFLSEAYGELVGFLYGWANLLVVTSGTVAALAVACATYAGVLVPLAPWQGKAVAVVALALVTAFQLAGVRAGARLTSTLTVAKLAGIALVVAVGLGLGSRHTSDLGDLALPASPGRALSAALVGVLWSYGGWQHVTMTAGETARPARDIPAAMATGAAIVTAVYLAANVAYLFLLDPAQMAAAPSLASTAVSARLGATGGALVAALIVLSTLGTAAVYTMTAPRMYWAMAERGLFFRTVARIDPRTNVPAVAIVLQSAWSAVLVLVWASFQALITYVLITEWIFYALAAFAVIVLRRRDPGAVRPFRVPAYPWITLFFVGVAVWFVASSFVAAPLESAAGVAFLFLGVPVFAVWRSRRRVR